MLIYLCFVIIKRCIENKKEGGSWKGEFACPHSAFHICIFSAYSAAHFNMSKITGAIQLKLDAPKLTLETSGFNIKNVHILISECSL